MLTKTIFHMLDDYSLICVTQWKRVSYPFTLMDDGLSSDLSRGPTPSYENGSTQSTRRYSPASNPIIELSQHFGQHSISPRQPIVARGTLESRITDHPRDLQSTNNFSDRFCRRRHGQDRLQCSSARLSRISALVEDMVHTGLPAYESTHPDPMLDDSNSPSLSPDEQQPSFPSYFGFMAISASSISTSRAGAYGSTLHPLRHSHSYKIDKDSKHNALRDGIGGQRIVKKKIRMRKKEKDLAQPTGMMRRN